MTNAGPLKASVTLLSFILAGLAPIGSAHGAGTKPPATARLMSGVEVYALYRNRTWHWEHGGGYMKSKKRQFWGWSAGDDPSFATGTWAATNRGSLCFKATWKTAKGAWRNLTCFQHMIDGKTIYQKKLPDGDWYVFRSSPGRRGDEYKKVVKTSDVPSGFDNVKASVETQRQK